MSMGNNAHSERIELGRPGLPPWSTFCCVWVPREMAPHTLRIQHFPSVGWPLEMPSQAHSQKYALLPAVTEIRYVDSGDWPITGSLELNHVPGHGWCGKGRVGGWLRPQPEDRRTTAFLRERRKKQRNRVTDSD